MGGGLWENAEWLIMGVGFLFGGDAHVCFKIVVLVA